MTPSHLVKLCRRDGRRFANSTRRVIKLWNIVLQESYRTRAGSGRLPAIYFANCKSSSGQVLSRPRSLWSRRRSRTSSTLCASHTAAAEFILEHNSRTAPFINSISNGVAQLALSNNSLNSSCVSLVLVRTCVGSEIGAKQLKVC